ncbi:class I SAM-dependent methyltransferase [Flammeovirga kamogawensis]|uniref:Class I SAM-dependent methyltransferase n=1 Tax=Flammeovirga kamogawensis TaxID=373891 RepID=A0ABX8GZM2_9BACT|nr:class I SAM-dependent methyltransferase [Flammeovirga kamogawensis]MBB6459507.1 ubiquinone/menaquinone biosynthesis C-methylase UbiE [Flammeovirga kamogawensis]QWG09058.1 class I SAM-dependent methyltransferase [Flammeovirga kamogawensis]TRX67347.1 class I SAM-dependent methyltransferase [Flammeovirga kamogawensis]
MGEYYHTEQSVKEYIQMAKDVNSENLIRLFENVLKKGDAVLEIGSGPGTDWSILNVSFKTIGSDFSKEFLHHLKEKFPEGEFLELDAITLKTAINFDGIYANKVLQHLTDKEIEMSVERQAVLLNDGGVVCHSYWYGEGDENFKGMYVNYQDEKRLLEIYTPYFEVLKLEKYKEFDKDDSIVIIGRKK